MVGVYDKENGELKRDLVLRTADKAYVEFEFVSHPEFIKPGMKLLFREGKTKVRAFILFCCLLCAFSLTTVDRAWA